MLICGYTVRPHETLPVSRMIHLLLMQDSKAQDCIRYQIKTVENRLRQAIASEGYAQGWA